MRNEWLIGGLEILDGWFGQMASSCENRMPWFCIALHIVLSFYIGSEVTAGTCQQLGE